MENSYLRPLGLGTLAALVAVLPAQAGRESFKTGDVYWIARGKLFSPSGIVALDDEHFLLQDGQADNPVLLYFRLGALGGDGKPAWAGSTCPGLPRDAVGLFGGCEGSFLVLHRDGDLSRTRVVPRDEGRMLGPLRKVLDAALRESAGIGSTLPRSAAELADGSVVLGYDGAVLRVVPAAESAGEGKGAGPDAPGGAGETWCQWVLGQAPDPGRGASGWVAGPGTRGLIVAAAPQGRILAVDPQTGKVSRIDPLTLKEETLATKESWPFQAFVPDEARAWGDTLFVSGFPEGRPLRTMVALEPAPDRPGLFVARVLGIPMEPSGAFAVTPAGHLAVVELSERGFRLVHNALAPGEPPQAPPQDAKLDNLLQALVDSRKQSLANTRAFLENLQAKPAPGARPRRKHQRKPAPVETKAGPTPEAMAQAEARFAELMAEERAAARKRAKREKRKARKQSGPEPVPAAKTESQAPAAPPQAAPAPVLDLSAMMAADQAGTPAASAPRPGAPAPAKDPDGPWNIQGRRGAGRPRPGPAAAAAPERRDLRTVPCGEVDQHGIAGRASAFASGRGFPAAFAAWAARQEQPSAQDVTVAALLEAKDPGPLPAPEAAPRGLGQFALSRPAMERAVRWMLREAGRANAAPERQAWRLAGSQGHPRFSFGMYEQARNEGRTTLEIRHLEAFAAQIDGAAGGLLARELAASEGITGLRPGRDGTVQFTYGVTVVLGPGNQSLWSVRPGGAAGGEHVRKGRAPASLPASAPAPAPPLQPAPAAASEAKEGGPAAPRQSAQAPQPQPGRPAPRNRPQRSRSAPPDGSIFLNPDAPEFVMPDG